MEEKRIFIFCLFVVLIFLNPVFAVTPVITSLPTTVSVGEGETADRIIHTILVTDADGDVVDCSVTAKSPTDAPFRTLKDSNTGQNGVYSDNATYDYAVTQTFTLTISCSDGTNTRTGTLTVKVIDGDLLDITNLPATTTHDASTTSSGATIYTCTESDALGHSPITYTMTSIPSSSSFTISSNGVVTAAQNLNLETNSQILLYITATDSFIEVTEILTVELSNLNNIPDITNLPASISVSENLAGGTSIYQITGSDADAGATLTYSMNVQPSTHSGYFTFNDATNLQVSLTSGFSFDYESLNYFNLTFTISDGLHSKTEILDVNIQNEFEACYFDKTYYHLSTVEGGAGSNSLNPGFVVQDHDGTTSYTLSFQVGNNSDRFNIGTTNGLISFAVDYNVDSSAMPSTVILTVQCEDTTSQTGTTKVEISIADVNDNAPTFGQTSYVLTVDQYTAAGSLLGSLNPTDADSGTNAQFSCSGSPVSSSASTYYSIGSDCGVYLQTSPSGVLDYGTMATFVVTAVDQGSTALTGTTTVNIIYKETTTTTVSTTTTTTQAPATNWFDDPTNVAIFCLALIFGLLLLAFLLYFLIRCCYTGACCGPDPFDFCNACRNSNDCCRPVSRAHRRVVTPREPAKGGPDDNYWGREREDSDYGSLRKGDTNTRGGGSTRYPVGRRDYPDFPQTSPARLTPTDVAPRIITTSGRPLPVGYY